jgi:hypothetical protein
MAIVVTSIAGPNAVLREIARNAQLKHIEFILIGDVASPTLFELDGCDFFDIERQIGTGLKTAAACRTRHYARKNIGYLVAAARGAETILETDDDNMPLPSFWIPRSVAVLCPVLVGAGWVNVYAYFSSARIWPRGLPLDSIHKVIPDYDSLPLHEVRCPIQQGLADGSPDVDAIYRLVDGAPVIFRKDRRVALADGSWCPFNSQNTTWRRSAFPLLYLPSTCSFRMTDIWRSLVAQRIAWANDWAIVYHDASVTQDRNDHDLARDFADEVPGYLNNRAIATTLAALTMRPGAEHLPECLQICYESLISAGFIDRAEAGLVDAWLDDIRAVLTMESMDAYRL